MSDEHDATSWIASEAGFGEFLRETRRLAVRAYKNPRAVVLSALLLTLLGVGFISYRGQSFATQVVYRLSESDLDATTAPPPVSKLRNYVALGIFSNERLLAIIDRFGLNPSLRKKDPQEAIESMREDIDVEVWRNYFLEAREPNDPGRTARVGITFHAKDPLLAYDVAHALGQLLVDEEAKARVEVSDRAAEQAALQLAAVHESIAQKNAQLSRERAQLAFAHGSQAASLSVDIITLQRYLVALNTTAQGAETRAQSFYIRAKLERANLGLRFDMVEGGRPAHRLLSSARRLTVLGTILFLVLLPLCALGVGAADSRIYTRFDLLRLAITPIAHIRSNS